MQTTFENIVEKGEIAQDYIILSISEIFDTFAQMLNKLSATSMHFLLHISRELKIYSWNTIKQVDHDDPKYEKAYK